MAVPDYQTLMLPVMRMTADGQDQRIADMVEALADEFRLSIEERAQRLGSGQLTIFSRTHWAVTYLAQARLLVRSSRGHVQITDRGREALASHPARIDAKFLSQYPEFQAFKARTSPRAQADDQAQPTEETPDERLESTFEALRAGVEADLLQRALAAQPAFFEQLVVDLLVAMGYGGSQAGAARRVGRTGDDGIDGVIDEDKLGLDAVYIQAKRWDPSHPVRRPDVQGFAGSMEGQRAGMGVFITTSRFTEDAREYTGRISKRIVLIDGQALAKLMYDHRIGVRDHRVYEVRRVDSAYFEGEV